MNLLRKRISLAAALVATLMGTAGCAAQPPALKGIDAGWVLLVRPEGRLYVDNATADWNDYLLAAAGSLTGKTKYSTGAECMQDGRQRFSGRAMVPGSEADEKMGGPSIQCVRNCRVDAGTVTMVCEEVTRPEIYR